MLADFLLGLTFPLVGTPSDASRLVKEPGYISEVCEAAPLVHNGRLLLMECIRPTASRGRGDCFITIRDVESGELLARFAQGYGLASAIVHGGELWVFASRYAEGTWSDVTLFRSRDLKCWSRQVVLEQEPPEHIFNTSVCATGDGFVMAYESDDPQYVPFTIKFCRSTDLVGWEKIPEAIFAPERYAACPALRWVDGSYYILYLEQRKPLWWFETFAARSCDLRNWELSARNPILAPEEGEDVNTSDPDLAEFEGKTYLYYSIGDQRTYAKLRRAVFPGTLSEFLHWCFAEPLPGASGTVNAPL